MRISGTEPDDYYRITVIPNYSRVFILIMHHSVGFSMYTERKKKRMF